MQNTFKSNRIHCILILCGTAPRLLYPSAPEVAPKVRAHMYEYKCMAKTNKKHSPLSFCSSTKGYYFSFGPKAQIMLDRPAYWCSASQSYVGHCAFRQSTNDSHLRHYIRNGHFVCNYKRAPFK